MMMKMTYLHGKLVKVYLITVLLFTVIGNSKYTQSPLRIHEKLLRNTMLSDRSECEEWNVHEW